MAKARGRLSFLGQSHRCAHLIRDCQRYVVIACLIRGNNLFKQCDAFVARCFRELVECLVCGGHSAIDVVGGTQRDLSGGFLICRVDDWEVVRLSGANPCAVNIELPKVIHFFLRGVGV